MSLDDTTVLKPLIDIQIVGGPAGITGDIIRDALVKLQYSSKQGKGRVPLFNIELDNSSGMVFNWAMLVVGLTLRIQFGYASRMSKPYLATVRAAKAANLATSAGRNPASPRPDVYGTVILEAQAHNWPIHMRPDKTNWGPSEPMKLSQAVRRIAQYLGYSPKKIFVQDGLAGDPVGCWQIKDGESFAEFLERHAKGDMGYVVKVSDKEIHFHSRTWKYEPTEDISYFIGPDLLSFQVDGDYTFNTQLATGKGLDALTGLAQVHIGDPSKMYTGALAIAPGSGGTKIPVGPDQKPLPGKALDSVRPTEIISTVARKTASAAIQRVITAAQNKWNVKLTLVGNPLIEEGTGIILDNFGPVVDGVWITKEVEQRFDSEGYTTIVSAVGKRTGTGACTTQSVHIMNNEGKMYTGAFAVTTCGGRFDKKHGWKKPKAINKKRAKASTVSETKSKVVVTPSAGYMSGRNR